MRRLPCVRLGSLVLGAAITVAALPMSASAQDARPVFTSAVDLVSVRAVVKDRRGRLVADLTADDFEVFDAGRYRPLVDFQSTTDAPVRVALLFDVSGSMAVSSKLANAAEAARHLVSSLREGDEAAIFAFDTSLREVQPFTADRTAITTAMNRLDAFGATSIYDAVAETARTLDATSDRRQAIVVVTDGIDTRSRLTAEEVSGVASAIDVPVYVLSVVSPIDHDGMPDAIEDDEADGMASGLGRLARWTGGSAFVTSAPAHASVAAREILSELRHQYLLAFEPGPAGWHELVVRVKDRKFDVRTRAGYVGTGTS